MISNRDVTLNKGDNEHVKRRGEERGGTGQGVLKFAHILLSLLVFKRSNRWRSFRSYNKKKGALIGITIFYKMYREE